MEGGEGRDLRLGRKGGRREARAGRKEKGKDAE